VASAVAVSAAPGLSLKVSTPSAVDGVQNLKVVTTLTNTGDETLKLLNDPRGALDGFPANTFYITDSTGASPAFVGAKVKYVPSADETSFTVLTPGQSVDVSHDLSAAYNLTSTGEGVYTIEPSNHFTYIGASGTPVDIHANNDASEVKVSGNLFVSRKQKRASFVGCSASQQSQLNTAAANAQSYAGNAKNYLTSHTSGTPRYTTWFGAYTSPRHSTVADHFTRISSRSFSSFTYDCTLNGCPNSNTYAFVYADTFGVIHLCAAFWRAPATGTDSQAGTLVHESSHFTANGGTQDYVYGQSGARSLANSDPNRAVFNADSHEYFAENTPAQS